MQTVPNVRNAHTDMPNKGELQTLTKQSMRQQDFLVKPVVQLYSHIAIYNTPVLCCINVKRGLRESGLKRDIS